MRITLKKYNVNHVYWEAIAQDQNVWQNTFEQEAEILDHKKKKVCTKEEKNEKATIQ